MDLKNLLFYIICIFHFLIWLIIIFGFLNKKIAKLNVYVFIPAVYIIQILPFHILNSLKRNMYKKTYKKKLKDLGDKFIITPFLIDMRKKLKKFCTFSPISSQGLLIFGMLSSIYSLYPINLFNINST